MADDGPAQDQRRLDDARGSRFDVHDASSPSLVTILFADVVSSTAQIAAMDLEEAQALLDQAVGRMRVKINQFGGTLARVQGDGVMAIFGAPVPMEDHALRACCAAHAMCEDFRSLGDDQGPINAIRVGVHSGRALIRILKGDRGVDYDAVGPDVHIAAKAEQQAGNNAVVITGETRALAGSSIVTTPRSPLAVSAARSVSLFDLPALSLSPDIDRLLAHHAQAPFVGRQKILERLIESIGAVRTAGRTVAIVGEAGIGKSRLVHEIARAARVFGVHVEEIMGISVLQHTPFAALRPFIASLLGCASAATIENITRAADALHVPQNLRPGLYELLGAKFENLDWAMLTGPARREIILDAISSVIERVAQRRHLLVLVEDVQHLDLETVDFLTAMKALSGRVPLSLLVTARQMARDVAAAATNELVNLTPLSPAESQQLCRLLASEGTAVTGAAIERAVERASGNPFFLQEILRVTSTAPNPADEEQTPLGIASLVQSRMASLSPDAKRVIQAASILAGEITRDVLAHTSATDEPLLTTVLAELDRENLIDITNPQSIRFRHDLFRGGARLTLLRAQASEMHARAAQAFETMTAGSMETFERLAFHAERSGQTDKALRQLIEASRLSVRTSSQKTIRSLYDWAMKLKLPGEAKGQLLDMIMTSLDALQQSGDAEEYEKALQLAIELSQSSGNRLAEGIARSHYSVFNWMRGRQDVARSHAEHALKIAMETQIYPLREVAQSMVATVQHAAGQLDEAIATFENLLIAGKDQDPRSMMGRMFLPSVRARAFLAHYLSDRGRFADAQKHLSDAEAILGDIEQPYSRALLRTSQGRVAAAHGDAADAVRCLEEARDLCLKHQLFAIEAGASGWLASALVQAGDSERGRAVARYSVYNKLYRQSGRYGWVYVYQGLAEAEFACANTAAALETMAQAITYATENAEPIHIAQTRFAFGCMLIDPAVGKAEQGKAEITAALAICKKHRLEPLLAHGHAALADLAKRQNDPETQRRHASEALALYKDLGLTSRLESVRKLSA